MNQGDKAVCIEEATENPTIALRSSGGFTLIMTEPWVMNSWFLSYYSRLHKILYRTVVLTLVREADSVGG